MKIGFIQGRLSPMVEGKIQAFPWNHWENEFPIASKIKLKLIEWTLDQEKLYFNPLMTNIGQKKIKSLCKKHNIKIPSLTGDCFMQYPFFKYKGNKRSALINDLKNIVEACGALNIELIIFPLVDNSSIEHDVQQTEIIEEFKKIEDYLKRNKVKIVFESDFHPSKLKSFIDNFPEKCFGINYDIGNSASLGFDYREELYNYGSRILNVHIKDRPLGGGTVPLGDGNADIPKVMRALKEINYGGNYILQTARALDNDHTGVLCKYRDEILSIVH